MSGLTFQVRSVCTIRYVLDFLVGVAVLAGVFEGLTRLALGRHWPLDVAAAVPVGLGVAFVVWQAVELISDLLSDPRRA